MHSSNQLAWLKLQTTDDSGRLLSELVISLIVLEQKLSIESFSLSNHKLEFAKKLKTCLSMQMIKRWLGFNYLEMQIMLLQKVHSYIRIANLKRNGQYLCLIFDEFVDEDFISCCHWIFKSLILIYHQQTKQTNIDQTSHLYLWNEGLKLEIILFILSLSHKTWKIPWELIELFSSFIFVYFVYFHQLKYHFKKWWKF
jgi:hypothetical protein